jgi:uncharacterized protein YyaL (SSP411 family)
MTRLRVLSTAVAWQPWGRAAFARARAERKPVLLAIATTWCGACREMDRTSYADPSIATIINERFVPIRVDAEERPDISERYSLGGWPTTGFLTPSGEILAGGTFVPADRMSGVLAQVADAFGSLASARDEPLDPADRTVDGAAPGRSSSLEPSIDAANDEEIDSGVFDGFDATHGGFGTEPKFPLIAPVQLALDRWTGSHESSTETILVATLDAMGWSALYDTVDGGFFRCATTSDWRSPHLEKLLDVNAALSGLYLDAGEALHMARFTERAADTLRYIQTWLADPVDGGWRGSQQADERYYAAASPEARRDIPPPAVAALMFADSNALMVQTALRAARVFNDDGLREFAVKSLERVLLACYRPGAGVAHYFDEAPRVRGLLADQFAMAAACLDVFDLTGNVVYEMMAEELGHYAVRLMWDDERGGFFDRAEDQDDPPGLMAKRLKPFAANCDASRTLRRLAIASGEREFGVMADRTLAAMAPFARGQGPLAAHYVLARRAAAAR